MTRLNLTSRTFLLIAVSIGVPLAVAQITGTLFISPLQAACAGLVLSYGLARAVSFLRTSAWRDVMSAVHESQRTGRFTPDFPMTSSLGEVNNVAEALNGAARFIAHSQADLDHAYLQFIETMAQALDARDPYTAGHSLRVAAYSHALAVEMGLSAEDAETIRIAAQLHDIGKIGIPDAVLQKPGQLTPEEYGLIKLHPQIGRKILEKVGRFEKLLAVVELHHENHDGTGYPYGFAGLKVPIDARIVHVADAFDAMTTTRSYRSARSLRTAMEEIDRHAGSQFDPVAARAFVKLICEGRIEIGGLEVSEETTEARQFQAV